jgi:hypothetical protein
MLIGFKKNSRHANDPSSSERAFSNLSLLEGESQDLEYPMPTARLEVDLFVIKVNLESSLRRAYV